MSDFSANYPKRHLQMQDDADAERFANYSLQHEKEDEPRLTTALSLSVAASARVPLEDPSDIDAGVGGRTRTTLFSRP